MVTYGVDACIGIELGDRRKEKPAHTVTVTLAMAISSAKAAEVLEQYGREKVRRRLYMREYRKPEKKANGEDHG